jgi:hypothetical protein
MSGLLAFRIDEETQLCGLNTRGLDSWSFFCSLVDGTKQFAEESAVSPANSPSHVDTPTVLH